MFYKAHTVYIRSSHDFTLARILYVYFKYKSECCFESESFVFSVNFCCESGKISFSLFLLKCSFKKHYDLTSYIRFA